MVLTTTMSVIFSQNKRNCQNDLSYLLRFTKNKIRRMTRMTITAQPTPIPINAPVSEEDNMKAIKKHTLAQSIPYHTTKNTVSQHQTISPYIPKPLLLAILPAVPESIMLVLTGSDHELE